MNGTMRTKRRSVRSHTDSPHGPRLSMFLQTVGQRLRLRSARSPCPITIIWGKEDRSQKSGQEGVTLTCGNHCEPCQRNLVSKRTPPWPCRMPTPSQEFSLTLTPVRAVPDPMNMTMRTAKKLVNSNCQPWRLICASVNAHCIC